jgi:hypothetical protein
MASPSPQNFGGRGMTGPKTRRTAPVFATQRFVPFQKAGVVGQKFSNPASQGRQDLLTVWP